MSVQVKGSGTIGGLDEGLVVSGIITSSTQLNVGSNIKLGSAGIVTASNFKTGVSNLHDVGLTLSGGQLDVGSNIKLGTAGVVTATSFVGSGANLTGITSPAITSIANDDANRVLTTDGDGTATAHSEVKIEAYSGGDKRLSINKGTGSTEVPLLVRRTDASGIVAEFSNSGGYGVYIGQNGATGEGYIRTATGQPLVFTTNSGSGIANERVRIDSAGRIGIGENNPTRDIVIKKSGSVQVSMVGATNQNVFLNFGDTDDDNIGGVYYDNTNNRMIIRANTNDAVQVKSNGNMAINDGDLVIGTAGHGIDFSATANAALFAPDSIRQTGQGYDPSTDSEVLTHYEHGTWTPRLRAYDHTGGAGWGHMVYSDGTVVEGTGRYVRIGRLVWAGFNIESGSKQFDTGWTYWSIDTIPFGANHYDGRSGGVQVFQTNAFTDTTNIIGGRVNGADAYLVGTRPSGEYNATINTSNTGRVIRGHAIFYTSTG